jgi:hypothetical protein
VARTCPVASKPRDTPSPDHPIPTRPKRRCLRSPATQT